MQLMRMLGEDGVSAYGVLMYVQLIFIGTAIGYSIGQRADRSAITSARSTTTS